MHFIQVNLVKFKKKVCCHLKLKLNSKFLDLTIIKVANE